MHQIVRCHLGCEMTRAKALMMGKDGSTLSQEHEVVYTALTDAGLQLYGIPQKLWSKVRPMCVVLCL